MNHVFLYTSIWLSLLIFSGNEWWPITFIIGGIYALYYYGKKFSLILFLVLIFCFVLLNEKEMTIEGKVFQIEDVRSNYVIGNNGRHRCILYNLENVDLLDVIEVEGEFEPIYSQKNANTYQFQTYMNRKGIYYSIYVKEYHRKAISNHPRALLYRFVKKKEQPLRDTLLSLLYRVQEEENTNLIFAGGMHLHFVSALFAKILKQRKSVIDLVVGFIYFVFFPAVSSIICMIFFAIIKEILPEMNAKDQLGLGMIMILLFDKSYLYEVSFQLSVLFRIKSIFDHSQINKRIIHLLILFPYQLFIFHECFLLELILFPFVRIVESITFICGICSTLFSFLSPFLNFMIDIRAYIESVMLSSYVINGKPYILWILLWSYLLLNMMSRKKNRYFLKFLFLIVIQINFSSLNPLGEVTFLDVGQGDAILIREPFNGQVMMIDVAGKVDDTLVEKRIYPYLKMEGIKEIDKIVITHDDYDHSGGLEELCSLIKVNEVIRDKREQICLKNICFYSVNNKEYEDSNDNSIVLYAQIGTLKYLFMGDASIQVEKQIMDEYNQLSIDVLKVGHHGSNTSSDLSFLMQMHPLLSIISSGKNNYYGHPHKEVLERLEIVDSYILNTQNNGSISIFFTSFINFLRTGNNEFGIII